jgi:L-ascorbate metabolism protein UlaG (beta-lactamase superfamily)
VHVRSLGWAGAEIEVGGQTLVIDPLGDARAVYAWAGERAADVPLPKLAEPSSSTAVAGLLTHLHRDHADAGALAQALGPDAAVLQPVPGGGENLEEVGLAHAEAELSAEGFPRFEMLPWQRVEFGPFAITALPAADGAGDPQLSWLVEVEGRRVLHCGDTLFHGYWWRIALRCGHPDVALMPICGATNDFPNRQPPSPFPAVMGPEQAAVAAELVGAGVIVPIHYGAFDFEPHYVPAPNCKGRFRKATEGRPYEVRVLEPGEVLDVSG